MGLIVREYIYFCLKKSILLIIIILCTRYGDGRMMASEQKRQVDKQPEENYNIFFCSARESV